MTYNLNGKNIVIHDAELEKLMNSLQISKEEAVELWLADHDYEENEEQNILNEKASKVQIDVGAEQKNAKKPRKKAEIKVSDEKKWLFESILTNLTRCNGVGQEDITVLNENKLISVKINDKIFKIDIIQTRQTKKS